jgi:uncharacterized membrane protein YbhN (UPF0104 family)
MNFNSNTLAEGRPNIRRKIYFALKVLVAGSLLVYLFSFVELKNIVAAFISADILMLTLSAALLVPNIYLQYLKWKITCDKLIGERSERKILLSLFYGFPAAVFTPARAGEYFGRGLAFKDGSFTEIILATFVDKLFTILVTFIIGSIGIILFLNRYYQSSIYFSLPMITAFFVFTAIALSFIFYEEKWFYKILSPVFNHKQFLKVRNRLLILKNLNCNFVFKMIGVSTLFFFCYLLQFAILFAAFSHHIEIIKFLWAAIIIMFAKTILSPISFSELGVREGASIFFLTQIGESSSTALNASLSLFVINIIIPSLIGLFLLFIKNDD